MNKVIISPSILSSDFSKLGLEINRLEENGADWIHVDVMDGHFVPNLTIGAPVVKSIRKVTKLPLDVHLMIENPEKYIKDFVIAGSDIITFHYEAVKQNTSNIIKMIKDYGIKAGISIKPKTNVDEIKQYIKDVDLVLVMTVEPGFGGQKFMAECADKISEIKKYKNDKLIIEVDGGINQVTAKYCKELGANALVAGNYIFSANNMKEAINLLR
ncbi:ribulose-phosphate 3-epimerase [bacterium]|nr:ribulose-phosphate 3-epimerase [bacterium]